MNAKPVVPREQALQDIDEAIAYHLSQDAEQAALGFIDEIEWPPPGDRFAAVCP